MVLPQQQQKGGGEKQLFSEPDKLSPACLASLPSSLAAEVQRAQDLLSMSHLSKGEALAAEDDYEQAQREFELADRPDLSSLILQQLALNALHENRYKDAAFYYSCLAKDSGAVAAAAAEQQKGDGAAASAVESALAAEAASRTYALLSQLYSAYSLVYSYVHLPFALQGGDAVFNAARFLLNVASAPGGGVLLHQQQQQQLALAFGGPPASDSALGLHLGLHSSSAAATGASPGTPLEGEGRRLPYGISIVTCLYALVKQAVGMQSFRVASFAAERLASCIVPNAWRETLETASVLLQSKPFSDREDLVPVCYACGASNSVLTATAGSLPLLCDPVPQLPRLQLKRGAGRAALQRGGGAAGGAASSAGREGGAGSLLPTWLRRPMQLWQQPSDVCTSCGHPFIRSILSYEPLPLVEFCLEPGLPASDAVDILAGRVAVDKDGKKAGLEAAIAASMAGAAGGGAAASLVSGSGDQQVLSFLPAAGGSKGASSTALSSSSFSSSASGRSGDELFNDLLNAASTAGAAGLSGSMGGGAGGGAAGLGSSGYQPVRVPTKVLAALRPCDVFVIWPESCRGGAAGAVKGQGQEEGTSTAAAPSSSLTSPRFFKNVIPDIALACCAGCSGFASLDDFEMAVLEKGCCPLCRLPMAETGLVALPGSSLRF